MKVLVAYMSHTGNTKKVAEAIYGALPEPKDIKPITDVTTLEGYDLSFLGFPMRQFGPDKQAKTFLETHVKDRAIALFVTHMSPEDAPQLQGWLQKYRDAAVGANILGFFDCQGQVSGLMKIIMIIPLAFMGKADTSQGQPDAARLERARTFANEIISKLKP
jgi:flavodoxin I